MLSRPHQQLRTAALLGHSCDTAQRLGQHCVLPGRTAKRHAQRVPVGASCEETSSLERGSKAYTHLAEGLDILVRTAFTQELVLPRGHSAASTLAMAAQTRLPVFAHESAAEHQAYAQEFVKRCQQDSAVFGEAVVLLSELIDLPRADALATLRLGAWPQATCRAHHQLSRNSSGQPCAPRRRNPYLILLPPAALAGRTLQLKLALPRTDLRAVVQRAPWLLTQEVTPAVAGVLGRVRLLMS